MIKLFGLNIYFKSQHIAVYIVFIAVVSVNVNYLILFIGMPITIKFCLDNTFFTWSYWFFRLFSQGTSATWLHTANDQRLFACVFEMPGNFHYIAFFYLA